MFCILKPTISYGRCVFLSSIATLLQSQWHNACSNNYVATCSTRRHECCKSMTQYNKLGSTKNQAAVSASVNVMAANDFWQILKHLSYTDLIKKSKETDWYKRKCSIKFGSLASSDVTRGSKFSSWHLRDTCYDEEMTIYNKVTKKTWKRTWQWPIL